MKNYLKLCEELHRSALITYSGVAEATMNFTFKLMTGRTWEEYKAAEEKFKKSIFGDPKSTGRTMRANPEIAEEIATFAHGG